MIQSMGKNAHRNKCSKHTKSKLDDADFQKFLSTKSFSINYTDSSSIHHLFIIVFHGEAFFIAAKENYLQSISQGNGEVRTRGIESYGNSFVSTED